jgi:ribonuclease-3
MTQQELEAAIGMRVLNFDKYLKVFTHKSASRATGRQSYERYEFLGDSVIGFVIATHLCDRFPTADEGFMTKVRIKLVSGAFLAGLAQKLGLSRFVVMHQRGIENGWNNNPRILEDVFESLIGCIYDDLGLMTAKNFLLGVIDKYFDFEDILRDTNYKDTLTRFAHVHGLVAPEYHATGGTGGGAHNERAMFDVTVCINGVVAGRGRDRSKKGAEQRAAKDALKRLGQKESKLTPSHRHGVGHAPGSMTGAAVTAAATTAATVAATAAVTTYPGP